MGIDFEFLRDTFLRLLEAVPTTLGLVSSALLLGGIWACVLVAMRLSHRAVPHYFARIYIFLFRGTPLLIQLFLLYYGVGQFQAIRDSMLWFVLREPYACAVISFALCTAAYTAEILRGAILSIPQGQIEAGIACGMSRFTLLRRIIAPVALRYALPAYSTEAVMITKATALASLVTVWEVTGVAQQIIQSTYRTLEVFCCAALIYLIINFLIFRALGLAEYLLSGHLRDPGLPRGAVRREGV
ncbi:ABC transporter permease [Paracandidimonas soli]|nr:ABC transporter permease subunit [Paracandidimonas soli]